MDGSRAIKKGLFCLGGMKAQGGGIVQKCPSIPPEIKLPQKKKQMKERGRTLFSGVHRKGTSALSILKLGEKGTPGGGGKVLWFPEGGSTKKCETHLFQSKRGRTGATREGGLPFHGKASLPRERGPEKGGKVQDRGEGGGMLLQGEIILEKLLLRKNV